MDVNESFRDFLEEHDVVIGVGQYENQDDGVYVDLSFYSPAGEDCTFTIDCTDNETFVEGVRKEYENFDVDEHVMLWAESRGQNGVPSTIKELLDDAEEIERILEELSAGLEKILAEIEEEYDEEMENE